MFPHAAPSSTPIYVYIVGIAVVIVAAHFLSAYVEKVYHTHSASLFELPALICVTVICIVHRRTADWSMRKGLSLAPGLFHWMTSSSSSRGDRTRRNGDTGQESRDPSVLSITVYKYHASLTASSSFVPRWVTAASAAQGDKRCTYIDECISVTKPRQQ